MVSSEKMLRSRISKTVISLVLIVFMTMLSIIPAFAATNTTDSQAKRELTVYVQSQLSQNEYPAEGGGYVSGKDLFTGNATKGYDLNEDKFNELTSSAQTDLVQDIANKSYDAEDNKGSNTPNVSEGTVQNWWKELQTKKGAGSKFLNVILENTKPDFVTANQIYAPFSGILGTIMGIIAVVGMALLGIVIVSDIFYIVIPPVRMLVSDENGGSEPGGGRGSRRGASKIFSDDALYAVRVAEESDDNGGSKKQALGVYLKRRIPMLILLGICLMYLVSGSIYTLVGYVLDLVSGFVGF